MVAFIFLGSAITKLIDSAETLQGAQTFGINATAFTIVGVVELLAIILFIIPRTGILGTLLLVAYMGGAIATHLEHEQSTIAPAAIAAFVWIVAVVRFPELTNRILNK
mgnify:CR=1 FL=1